MTPFISSTIDPDLGYLFTPIDHPHHPGASRLEVILRDQPTYHHYDPEIVAIQVITDRENLETLMISHPWPGENKYQVCTGKIRITDRRNLPVEAFSMGGSVAISPNDDHTHCVITSPAPIYPMIHEGALPMMVGLQFEMLMAQRRAAWLQEPQILEARLRTADPRQLYRAFIHEIREKLQRYPLQNDPAILELSHFISAEIHRLEGHETIFQDAEPSLETLL
jgi:hypothetical protein